TFAKSNPSSGTTTSSPSHQFLKSRARCGPLQRTLVRSARAQLRQLLEPIHNMKFPLRMARLLRLVSPKRIRGGTSKAIGFLKTTAAASSERNSPEKIGLKLAT